MAIVRQLFRAERDPTRPLNEIVNAEQAIDVRSEIDEYVFTDHTREYLRTLVEALLDTAQGQTPDALCGWIAGFFGSGKSHFLKLAAAALENRPIAGESASIGAFEYLVRQHRLDIPFERVSREFKVQSVTVNLALAIGGGKRERERPLLHRLESEIFRAWGLSRVPHVAALEREIRAARKWDTFLDLVRKRNEGADERDNEGVPYEWTDAKIRDLASDAHRILEDVLGKVLPKYSTNVRDYLRDKEAEHPSPTSVVELAVQRARELDPNFGRVLLCVDEIALYLKGPNAATFDADRVREVQGLAEMVKERGRGKVFLFATAQLRVDAIDAKLSDLKDHVLFLRDRFPKGGRLELEERDIDTVVLERWLQKDPTSPYLDELRASLKKHGDMLANFAKLKDVSLLRDDDRLTDPEALLAYYPLLPYHVRLLQEILSALQRDDQVGQAGAQNRAILGDVRSLFVGQRGNGLADARLDTLVTFDRVYEVVRSVVHKADPDTTRWIEELIDPLPAPGGADAIGPGQVARVVLLLQQLNPRAGRPRVRVSAENVAALLYARLGTPWEPHLAEVRLALAALVERTFLDEEPDAGFRFYREDEQSFRKKVAGVRLDEPSAVHDLVCTTTREALTALGLQKLVLPSKNSLAVDVASVIGAPAVTPPVDAPLFLEVAWLPASVSDAALGGWAARLASNPARLVCALALSSEIYDVAREILQLGIALRDHERDEERSGDVLRRERARLDRLRGTDLPDAIRRALDGAVLVHEGRTVSLAGSAKPFAELLRARLLAAVQRTFTELEVGDVVVDDPRRALTWKPSQTLPEPFKKLALYDASGTVLVGRAFLKALLDDLRGRLENDRTGARILERFERIPYGWPENAVKAGFGALLRARRIVVRVPGSPPIATEDDRAQDWLGTASRFNKAVVEPAQAPEPADVERLASLFSSAFCARGLDTLEKQEKQVTEVLAGAIASLREAAAALEGTQLPGAKAVASAAALLERAKEAALPAGRLQAVLSVADELTESAFVRVLELARTVGRLRAAQKLERLVRVRARALEVYRQAEGLPGLADLQALVSDEGLLARADDALQRDERCFAAYADRFQTSHSNLGRFAAEARAEIERHPSWPALADARRATLLTGISACKEPGILALASSSDGRCPGCARDLRGLETQAEVIEGRTAAAKRELDAVTAGAGPRPPSRPPNLPPMDRELSIEIAGDTDVGAAVERIEAELRRGQGARTVRVSIRSKAD
jgi:hypothetical protein